MTMAIKGYHTAAQIIDEALVKIRDFDRKYYIEAATHFMSGYRDFQLFNAGGEIKEAYRPLTAVNTVNFPEDLLRVLQVGVMVDGEFFSFTRSDKMVNPSDPIDSVFNTNREEGETLRRVPTYGYGTKGTNVEYYYKEDRERRRIILARVAIDVTRFAARSEVIFRYVSTGIEDFNQTHIASDAANLLTSYIEWKLIEGRPDQFNMNYIEMKRRNFLENQKMYEALELPDLQQMIDVVYETSSQNIRRI